MHYAFEQVNCVIYNNSAEPYHWLITTAMAYPMGEKGYIGQCAFAEEQDTLWANCTICI